MRAIHDRLGAPCIIDVLKGDMPKDGNAQCVKPAFWRSRPSHGSLPRGERGGGERPVARLGRDGG
jgi:hypothetical protein